MAQSPGRFQLSCRKRCPSITGDNLCVVMKSFDAADLTPRSSLSTVQLLYAAAPVRRLITLCWGRILSPFDRIKRFRMAKIYRSSY